MRVIKKIITLAIIISLVLAMVPVIMAEEQTKVDLNTASVEELVQIKGIGQKYAQRIVEYREQNGPFSKAEDVMKIKGIGSKKFESIKDLITVESPAE